METLKQISPDTKKEIINYAIERLKNRRKSGIEGADIHNALFNEDYYIIGTYQAEKWMEANGGVYTAIRAIQEYEQNNFGKVNTDLADPEKVVNMYVYILGEAILNECKTLSDCFNRSTTPKDVDAIIRELKSI